MSQRLKPVLWWAVVSGLKPRPISEAKAKAKAEAEAEAEATAEALLLKRDERCATAGLVAGPSTAVRMKPRTFAQDDRVWVMLKKANAKAKAKARANADSSAALRNGKLKSGGMEN